MKDDFSLKGEVIDALAEIRAPGSDQSLVDAHIVEQVDVASGAASVTLLIPEAMPREERFALEDQVADAVEAIAGIREAKVIPMTEAALRREKDGAGPASAPPASGPASAPAGPSAAPRPGPAPAPAVPASAPVEGVGRLIAIASGKGGVGKSTVAVNLALALQKLGHRVGLLDVDIYGPSLPTLLGVDERPSVRERRIVPLEAQGLRLMSLGFLMEEDTPVIWRGPIVTGIIRQFLRDVDWSGLDYLIVDMPPGTGDAQLALAQAVPVDGAVVVTTPSEIALLDAARGLQMFKTLDVKVLGIVSNMAKFVAPDGSEHFIFGEEGAKREAERLGVPLLAEIPLDPAVRAGGDRGEPIVRADPDSASAKAFVALAERLVAAEPPEPKTPERDAPKKGLFSFLKS